MENRNCDLPAPIFYRTAMQASHVISYPIYIATLIVLFRETSKAFRTYKYFIIVHVLINMISETYVSFLMLPVTYLPHVMLRTTGFLARLGFSGVFQWYALATFVMLTGVSICEMFYYRFKVSIADYKYHRISKFVASGVWAFRFLTAAHVIFASCTINESLKILEIARTTLYKEYPSLPAEVTCYSVVIAIFDDWINAVVMVCYVFTLLVGVTTASCALFYMMSYLKNLRYMSKVTIRLHSMLISSLFIQGGVHASMIAAPNLVLVYARFYGLGYNPLALLMMMCLAYHGFFSTCAMIMFTKPIRDKMFPCGKPRPKVVHVLLSSKRNESY